MLVPQGFCDLKTEIPELILDIRYATPHNLTGHPLAGYGAARAIGTWEMCRALRRACALAGGRPFRVFDAYRPQRAVADFVRWAKAPEDGATRGAFYPRLEKAALFPQGYIAEKSGHSRGSTIDLTLEGLDMGSDFDLMDERSHHGAAGLTQAQHENRELLKALMQAAGFAPCANEWWHYRLEGEPFPDTYFDFPIR